ncbi:VOC family protein [Arhodomonas sp. AD133]|uniref:VOC family protein n=1 Tax=Arhodomonas sp. AD133 TaxID=3415009 RepID=UPI003EB6F2C3
MSDRPPRFNGMRHIALQVRNLEECERFYVQVLGMDVLRRAHENLVYLTLGNDNLSLGRLRTGTPNEPQRLDHFGFVVDRREDVDAWYEYVRSQNVETTSKPHDHADGARSFYCLDPAGNTIQPLYHPTISGQRFSKPGQ